MGGLSTAGTQVKRSQCVDSVPVWGDDEVDNERDDTDVVIIIRNYY